MGAEWQQGASSPVPRRDGRAFEPVVVDCVPLIDLIDGPLRLLKLVIDGVETTVMRAFLETALVRPDYVLTEQWSHEEVGDDVVTPLIEAGYRVHRRFGTDYLLLWPEDTVKRRAGGPDDRIAP